MQLKAPILLDNMINQTDVGNKTEKDTALFLTKNNGNSRNESYLSVTTKLADEPVINKLKVTSFHTVQYSLALSDTTLYDDTVIPTNSKISNV